MLLDIPDALAAATRIAEEGNVAGVALWIVGTYQTEQGTLAGTVLSAQRPAFAIVNRPVEIVEDDALAILDADLVHLHHFLTVIFPVAIWQVDDGLF